MAKKDRPSKAKAERTRAVQRLNEAVTERRRLRDEQVTATDLAGNTVSQTIEFRMSATIDSLAAAVNLLVTQGRIQPQLSASLRAKLDEARQAVTRGNVSAAHGLLHAFGNQIAAQSGGTIEPGAANILLADVQYVAGAM